MSPARMLPSLFRLRQGAADWAVRLRPHGSACAAFALAFLVVVTRLPFATSLLYNWDSVNYAEGMRAFNVARFAPHPPGYPYYVGLARLLDVMLEDANRSLVLVSVVFSALTVVAVYYLGCLAYDHLVGVVAALCLAGSVTFWAYGTIALPYTVLAFFSTACALASYIRLRRPATFPLWLLTLLYSVAGGFRPDLLLFLAPLWGVCLFKASWGERVASGLLALLGFAAWFLPTVVAAGGLAEYWAIFAAYLQTDVLARYSTTHRGLPALLTNARETTSYLFYALYALTPWFLLSAGWLLASGRWRREALWPFVALWVGPMLGFYTIVHIGEPGYVFAVLPGFCLVMGRFGARTMTVGGKRFAGMTAVMGTLVLAGLLAANTVAYATRPMPLSAVGIRRNDVALAAKLRYIRSSYRPDEIALLSYSYVQHLRYYLPADRQVLWVDRFNHRQHHARLPDNVRYVLLVDDDLVTLVKHPDRWEEVAVAPDVKMLRAEFHHSREVEYGEEGIDVD